MKNLLRNSALLYDITFQLESRFRRDELLWLRDSKAEDNWSAIIERNVMQYFNWISLSQWLDGWVATRRRPGSRSSSPYSLHSSTHVRACQLHTVHKSNKYQLHTAVKTYSSHLYCYSLVWRTDKHSISEWSDTEWGKLSDWA